MDFKEFHQQSQKYALSRVKDKITGDKHREQLYLLGNTMPKWEPQGSFIRMSYGVPNVQPLKLSGGSRSQAQQQAVQQQLKNRAQQLMEMTGTQEMDNLPGATQRRQTPRALEKNELELFFSDLSSLNFTGSKIPMKEIKEAIKNLRLSGLGLNVNTLIRFKDIAEDAVNLFIQNINENKNLDFKTAFDNFRISEEPQIYNYIQNLQTLPAFELIYKIYLILVSLINNFNLQLEDRKQIFTQHYEEVLKARPDNLFDGDTKTAFDIAKDQVKELKEIMPKDFYQAIFKKQGTTVKDLIKIKPEEEEDEVEIVEVNADGGEIEAVGQAEQKEGSVVDELDDFQGYEVESVTDEDEQPEGQQPGGQADPGKTKAEIKRIKTKATRDTNKLIKALISGLQFPMSDSEADEQATMIYEEAIDVYGSTLQEENIQLDEAETEAKLNQIMNQIFPVIERKNNQASKKRKSSKKSPKKKGKGFFQDFTRELLLSLI